MKKIIVLAGHSGSGKGTVAAYLAKEAGAVHMSYSAVFRNILDELYIPQSRENIDTVSKSLRDAFGQDILGHALREKLQQAPDGVFVVEAARRPEDVTDLEDLGDVILCFIDVSLETRHRRVVERNENPGDAEKTIEDFRNDQEADAQVRIDLLSKAADIIIDNNGTLEDFEKNIREAFAMFIN